MDAAGEAAAAVVVVAVMIGISAEVTGVRTADVRTKMNLEGDLAAEVSKTATITTIVVAAMVDQVARLVDLPPSTVVPRRRHQHSRSHLRYLR